jgi:hypothetical protein
MSYDAMLDAMKSDPALAQRLHDAGTVSERAEILKEAGIEAPTLDSPLPGKDQLQAMSDVAGGDTYFNATACAAA